MRGGVQVKHHTYTSCGCFKLTKDLFGGENLSDLSHNFNIQVKSKN